MWIWCRAWGFVRSALNPHRRNESVLSNESDVDKDDSTAADALLFTGYFQAYPVPNTISNRDYSP